MTTTGLGLRPTSTKNTWRGQEFSTSLYRELCSAQGNVALSPYGIWLLLALVSEGCAGETRDELVACLGPSDRKSWIISTQTQGTRLEIATGIWTDGGKPLKRSFVEKADQLFGAKVEALDLSNPESLSRINKWVSTQTAGKIQNIVDCLGKSQALVAANAVYFKGDWNTAFEASSTSDRPFVNSSGESTLVPTMQRSGVFRYLQDSEIQAVKLPYSDPRFSMIIVLPRRVDGLGSFVRSLDGERFSSIVSAMGVARVDLLLPRFKFEAQYDLLAHLKALGIKMLLDPGAEDFRGISEGALYVDSILHRCALEVNETGTEAAAATVITWLGSGEPKPLPKYIKMTVDHPFFFAIHDESTGAIVVMGSVNDPTSR